MLLHEGTQYDSTTIRQYDNAQCITDICFRRKNPCPQKQGHNHVMIMDSLRLTQKLRITDWSDEKILDFQEDGEVAVLQTEQVNKSPLEIHDDDDDDDDEASKLLIICEQPIF
jgi:hypothetical protein